MAGRWKVSPKEERTVDGILFASKREAARYGELKLLAEAGKISGLRLQPEWEIVINGQLVCKYRADFFYTENGKAVVEDVKSSGTRKDKVYQLKKKLMAAVHNIEIWETG